MSWNTKIPKFRRFVLQNFPFIEEDFDALTDYQLICKVVEYLNTVIQSQNELITETESFESSVTNEINTFETNITSNFNRLEGLFNQLKSYVDNYFDNLDVQQEINNKLDAMVESGTLQEIVADYLNSRALFGYNTVADMQSATNLIDGSFAYTMGYYSINDGGSAVYKITEDEPDSYYETLNSGLYAKLIIKPTMYIKQFGAKGDGITDDSSKFNQALLAVKRLIINNGTYLIDRFLPYEYQEIIGEGTVTLNLNGTTAPLADLPSNFKMSKVALNSLNENLSNSRTAISEKSNVTLEDCKFIGFRHDSATPNAWGILISRSNNVNIRRCYFDNNSQADIAFGMGCVNILIDNCSGTHLNINIEPENITYANQNIKISNCNIEILKAQENQYTGTCTKSLLVENCKIDTFRYDGSTMTFVNCIIGQFAIPNTTVKMGGVIKFVNTCNFSGNMIDDPYLDLFQNTTDSVQPWHVVTNPLSLQNAFTTVKDVNGIQTVINHLNNTTGIQIKHQDIDISANSQYLLRITGKCYYPESGTANISIISKIEWLDGTNTSLRTDAISLFRSSANSTSEFGEECTILVPPATATKAVIKLFNATAATSSASGSQSLFIRSVELFEFNSGKPANELPLLPVRQNRIFKKATQVGGTFNKYLVGDMLLYSEPSTYIGKVCTVEGYGNAATWKDFGALAS